MTYIGTFIYLAMSNSCYATIVFCFLKIRKFVAKNMKGQAEKERRRANRQISLMLILQVAKKGINNK